MILDPNAMGHVWRVPIVLGATAATALLFFAAIVVASTILRRRTSSGVRAGTISALVLLALVIGCVLRATATTVARSSGVSLAFVEPGPVGYLAPMLYAGFAFVVGNWALSGAWTSRQALMFYAWLVVFTAANIINWCSPGWCEAVGFPFTWRSGSDLIITVGEGTDVLNVLAAAIKTIGGGLNLATFAAGAYVLGRRFRNRPLE